MKKKRVVLPLRSQPICGHWYGHFGGDLMCGRESGIKVIERNGVEYIGSVEYGSCSKCNKAQDKRIEQEVAALEKERAKTAGNRRSRKRIS